ncbi:MAG: phosphoribosylglycinamide formyltransferase [Flavobacteriales bacterium]|nr:phosphoribosylglycinamide formyltransferase [Flavobacteriales bacterium]
MINIVVFASGNGSNALNIRAYFKNHSLIHFSEIYCNKENAGIVGKSKDLGIPIRVFNRQEWTDGLVLDELKNKKIEYIILAGFLWKVPTEIIDAYQNRILNIHPSLLPKYGGKGMYGEHVHEAVLKNNENESGITIHLVNDEYDKGKVLFREIIKIEPEETGASLAEKIHKLEHEHFPQVIENYILSNED